MDPRAPFDSRSTFEKARRKRAVRDIGRKLRDENTEELLPLSEVTERLRLFNQTYLGVRPIPVGRIVGTVDRSHEFDREFLPRRSDMKDRWQRVERSFSSGDFPPVQVYEVDGRYFLVDGHHRVAIARQRGTDFLDAEVTRIQTRFPLPEDADVARIIHTEQERVFMEESGLERARPEARIQLSRPQGYLELLDQIKVHGYNLMQERGSVLSREEIAGHWYDTVYLPTREAIRAAGLHDVLPHSVEGDLYLAVQQHRIAMSPERRRVTFQDAASGFKDSVTQRLRGRAALRPGVRVRKRAGGK